jgi:tRNA(Ile2) C34 agmatinyltransferase TiaS
MAVEKKRKVHADEFVANIKLTGKHRIWIVIGIAWMLFWLFAITPWSPYQKWASFIAVGIGPVALILAGTWIRRGLAHDRKEIERAARESKQTVKCPNCPQIWHRAPGQTEFKCSRCGTAFQYCQHCGSSYGTN